MQFISGARRTMRLLGRVNGTLILSLLAGCAALPNNGPTGHQIVHDVEGPDNVLGIKLIDITPQTIHGLATGEEASSPLLRTLAATGPVDRLGPGDVLSVEIYEVGSSLFGGGRALIGGGGGDDDSTVAAAPSATGQSLGSGIMVAEDGSIALPYIGRLTVAGETTNQVEQQIVAALRGKSQSPQALVTVRKSATNSVVVMGGVARPGRLALTPAPDHLLDAIADAGGFNMPASSGSSTATGTGAQDFVVRFTRKGRSIEQPLDMIESGAPDDLLLLPGDRIELLRQPRTFTVFGATDHIAQLPFESRILSLAEALARIGGPSDSRGDPRSIFVFRYVDRADDTKTAPSQALDLPQRDSSKPIIYRFNMMNASSYFLAQKFAMRDKDVVYISNSSANQPTKLVQIINLLFSPVYAIRTATQ